MALNSPMHEAYLSMPIEANLMPELTGLPYWARMTHEILQAVNPAMLTKLALEDGLQDYLKKQQTSLASKARKLEREWRQRNPLPATASYQERTSWQNHGKLAAREILIEELFNGSQDSENSM